MYGYHSGRHSTSFSFFIWTSISCVPKTSQNIRGTCGVRSMHTPCTHVEHCMIYNDAALLRTVLAVLRHVCSWQFHHQTHIRHVVESPPAIYDHLSNVFGLPLTDRRFSLQADCKYCSNHPLSFIMYRLHGGPLAGKNVLPLSKRQIIVDP